jgi:hypothetical protein
MRASSRSHGEEAEASPPSEKNITLPAGIDSCEIGFCGSCVASRMPSGSLKFALWEPAPAKSLNKSMT